MDLYLFEQINQYAGKWLWLDTLGIYLSRYFEYVLIFCVFLFLLKDAKKYWRMIVEAAFSVVLSRLVIVEIIRYFLPRSRPFVENSVNLLIFHAPSSSFPSGHASFYFALSTAVYLYNKKAGLFFFVASFLISFARVFAGVHWPSDIIAGAVVGILSAFIIVFSFRKFFLTAKKLSPQ